MDFMLNNNKGILNETYRTHPSSILYKLKRN